MVRKSVATLLDELGNDTPLDVVAVTEVLQKDFTGLAKRAENKRILSLVQTTELVAAQIEELEYDGEIHFEVCSFVVGDYDGEGEVYLLDHNEDGSFGWNSPGCSFLFQVRLGATGFSYEVGFEYDSKRNLILVSVFKTP